MNIMMVCENQKFVLKEECPPEPPATATRTVREKYDSWIQTNNKVKCYMLASMSDVLRQKHENMEFSYEIWESLQAMFGQPSDQSRHESTRRFMNARMKKGAPVRDHVLDMINTVHEAEIHGATIDDKTQVSIILGSLTSDFAPFTTNYIMNKLEYNLTQLLNELQTFEAISKIRSQEREVNVTEQGRSSSAVKNKKKKKANGGSESEPKAKKQFKGKGMNKSKKKEPKGKYFYRGIDGHWKRNCKKYLAEKKEQKKGGGATITKPGCPSKCGNLTVPYPFGVGSGCGIGEWFELNCSTPAEALIGSIQIRDISDNHVRVSSVVARTCYDKTGSVVLENDVSLGLSGTAYNFSNLNKFAIVGCDDLAFIYSRIHWHEFGRCRVHIAMLEG
ncbi:hypothetical protein RD792_013941 [Penstemon davidsonii]|uniref:Wall-associated receptor kinase galacturonan-binding domain-containing protein n=1 Tax=Penstemon davidsonii TaxID=160366 RepID=A0ABR0CPN7_9LAMI|nr:hypothetical protein RD792_013941 [Penstemon davidsonii]